MVPLLSDDLVLGLDRVRFAEELGISPDLWQRDLLRSTAKRVLLNMTRQGGKSTTAAVIALHRALYYPQSLVLVLAPALRQSQELFGKIAGFYRTLGRPVAPQAERRLSLELENASRIVTLPGTEKTIRGFSGASLILVDEAARVANDLYASIRPMLAVSGGRLLAMSSPFGTRGWFYDAWVSAEPWERYEVPATQVPRISPEFLAEERRTLGEWWFEQEYMCRFLDAQTQAFTREEVDKAFTEEVEAWAL